MSFFLLMSKSPHLSTVDGNNIGCAYVNAVNSHVIVGVIVVVATQTTDVLFVLVRNIDLNPVNT